MKVSPAEVALRVFGLVGLAMSSLLLFEYLEPAATFCGKGGGCDVVRLSAYSHLGPIPTPAFGLSFFALVTLLSLVPDPRARRLLPFVAGAGAMVSGALLAVQGLVLHTWCKYCVVTDLSALALFGAALALRRRTEHPGATARLAYAVTSVLAILVPLGVGYARVPSETPTGAVPEVVVAEQRKGVATIVEFVDFECPYCRKQHVALAKILEEYGERVRVVRKNVPLPMHEHAVTAARAYCCADEAGKGEEMADALFRSEDLTGEACGKLAYGLGVEEQKFLECVDAQRTKDRILGEVEVAKTAGVEGLPTFWVGKQRFIGVQDDDVLRKSIDQAIATAQ